MTELAVAATWDIERVWPNFAQAAELLAIDRSTLTKQAQSGRFRFVTRGIGRGERLIPTAEVIRLACAYRRIPVDDVLVRLARQIAPRALLEEARILRDLGRLAESTCSRVPRLLAEAVQPTATAGTGSAGAEPRDSGLPDGGRAEPRVVPLGRLRPRAMREDEFPAEGLAEALDARRPWEPRACILARKPRVVHLGRLRPGDRY